MKSIQWLWICRWYQLFSVFIYVNIPINHAPHVPQIVVFPWQCLVCVSMATFDLQWRPGRSPEGDERAHLHSSPSLRDGQAVGGYHSSGKRGQGGHHLGSHADGGGVTREAGHHPGGGVLQGRQHGEGSQYSEGGACAK